jgi:uncharacterized protein
MDGSSKPRLRIGVVGAGISGLAAAWLLSRNHTVKVFDRAARPGGHSLTVDVPVAGRSLAVDMGFIVFNTPTYPNLTALFAHLGVVTEASQMSFGVSLDDGRFEYSGGNILGLFAQRTNAVRPRLWSMIAELVRFYRTAPGHLAALEANQQTLGAYLDAHHYGAAFRRDHLLPMAAAIWSAPALSMLDYPAAAFIRFFENHGLLKLASRPVWRTVTGGSRNYVERLTAALPGVLRQNRTVTAIHRDSSGVLLVTEGGSAERFDHVIVATHADQALALLIESSLAERRLLGAFSYTTNRAYLHTDERLMPRRRAAWSSWNVIGDAGGRETQPCVTYWMNQLQSLPTSQNVFVTLNPRPIPRSDRVLHSEVFRHPLFDTGALKAQKDLWSLQAGKQTWFCGSYFGTGFHEDGLQAGLAVAEALGGERRPWSVPGESSRIHLNPAAHMAEYHRS